MSTMRWAGVMPAITSPLTKDHSVDLPALREHVAWLVGHRVTGIVALGSLGEGATLDSAEKRAILTACVASAGSVPTIAGISALSTREAVGLAKDAEHLGCRGLMVLPPYVYLGDARETQEHFDAVISATRLPCMLYNNPIAYGTDLVPETIANFAARHANVEAVKDSSGDARRITAIHALCGTRLALFAGLDDMAVEGASAGAVGWVAGLVNALPRESIQLFELARQNSPAVDLLYQWFLPLLRLDTHVKFVQMIKLVQQELGRGTETVRAPRLPLMGEEREQVLGLICKTLANRPKLP